MRKSLATAAISLSLLTGIGIGTTALGSAGAQEATAPESGEGARRSPVEWIRDALNGLVDDGTINDAQADKVAETLAEARPPRGPGGPGPGHGRIGPHGRGHHRLELAAAANALGMSEADLRTALHGGKTLAQIAEERDVDLQKVKDALIAAETAKIDAAVAAGRLTADEAARIKEDLPTRVDAVVTKTHPARHHRHGPPPEGAPVPEPPAAEGTSL